LADHQSPHGYRQTVPGQQHLGHRVQVERIRLEPTPTLDLALLGHMRWVQLQNLPPGRPHRRRQQGPVVVTARLHPDLDRHMRAGQQATDLTDHGGQR
jgi:hypothetical protein